MARVYLEQVGLHCPFLIVFLSDGKQWRFFRVARSRKELTYLEGPVVNDAKKGWEHYLALLTATSQELGHVVPQVDGVEIVKPLGCGGSSTVYKGKDEVSKAQVVVKVYNKGAEGSLEAERKALLKLANVPQLVGKRLLQNAPDSLDHTLVVTPVGIPVLPCRNGLRVNGSHLRQLVQVVKEAHELKLVHRDLKPHNIFLFDNNILLSDWGSSVSTESSANPNWEDTVGFSVAPMEPDFDDMMCLQVRDLVSLVRCAYVLLFQEMPPMGSGDTAEEAVTKNWQERFCDGTYWKDAIEHAKNTEYDKLGTLLGKLK